MISRKERKIHSTIPQYLLPEKYLSIIEKSPGTDRQYLGQPDLVLMEDGKNLFTVYPRGHGAGTIIMQVSNDAGESWQEKTNLPSSWKDSLETPTIYKLNFKNKKNKLILISGRPNWKGNAKGGWQTSISEDEGESWSEFKQFHPHLPAGNNNWSLVAMSSLLQLHNEEGEPKEEWMGVYHDQNFINYKTILTFDEEGREQWSPPIPYLSQYRTIEEQNQVCEVCLFRTPNKRRILALARCQSHLHPSLLFYSDDEGDSWSEPLEMQGSLQGERHKAVYDPISGRLVITFREIQLDYNRDGKIEKNDWMAGDWVAWIGTYQDLLDQTEGQYRLTLAKDWTQSSKSGDTGYAGIAVHPNGTFIINSYGHFDKQFSERWKGSVLSDLSYIIQAKFKLTELEDELKIGG